MKTTLVALTAALLTWASAAPALTLQTDGAGELTGATGVIVGGSSYDVQFVDGTCATIFGSCGASTDFAFTTDVQALAAGQALIDQVFVGIYHDQPSLTVGCSTLSTCTAIVPWAVEGGALSVVLAENCITTADCSNVSTDIVSKTFDTGLNPVIVFARFTTSAAVPEPRTWIMMLFGFGAIGFARRFQTRPNRNSLKLA